MAVELSIGSRGAVEIHLDRRGLTRGQVCDCSMPYVRGVRIAR